MQTQFSHAVGVSTLPGRLVAKFLQYVLFANKNRVKILSGDHMKIIKLLDTVKFYFHFIISGFTNGGSWKLNRITELNNVETRKILIRNMSTYRELLAQHKRVS